MAIKKGGKMPSIKTTSTKGKRENATVTTAKDGVFGKLGAGDNPYGGAAGDPTHRQEGKGPRKSK